LFKKRRPCLVGRFSEKNSGWLVIETSTMQLMYFPNKHFTQVKDFSIGPFSVRGFSFGVERLSEYRVSRSVQTLMFPWPEAIVDVSLQVPELKIL